MLTAPTTGVTIGTLGAGVAAFNVHGDQMAGGGTQELIRTRAAANANGFWRMFRANTEMGRFYQTNPFNAFRVQAVQPNGAQPGMLCLENAETDGIMLRANGAQFPVNGYPLQLDGFGSIGIRNGGTLNMPSRSRWHMVDVNGVAVVEPWRPYYRNGVLFSGNNDMAYIGHRYLDEGNGTTPWNYTLDRSDLLISAGENDMTDVNRQRIRFTYTTTPAAAGSTVGADSYNGLEFMQLWAENNTQGYLGVGDFTAASATPTERVDLLTKTIRFRDFMDATLYRNDNYDRVLVANPADGRVYWRQASSISSCDWLVSPPVQKQLLAAYTAVTPGATCPQEDWRVSIGTVLGITSKLKVYGRRSVGDHGGAIQAEFQTSGTEVSDGGSGVTASVGHETPGTAITGDALGVDATVNDIGYRGYGVRGTVTAVGSNTTEVNGVSAFTTLLSGSSTQRVYGLRSDMSLNSSSAATQVYGTRSWVYGAGSASSISGVSSLVEPSGSGLSSSYGLDATSTWTGGTALLYNKGAEVASRGTGTITNSLGLDAAADGTEQTALTIGARGKGYGSNPNATFSVTGVHGEVSGTPLYSRGVYGYNNTATTDAADRRFGLMGEVRYAYADTNSWNVCVYGEFPGIGVLHQWAGYFNGQVNVIGNMFHGSTFIFSDEQIKTNVEELNDQANQLMSLHPHKYTFTDEARDRLHLSGGEQFGFLAQELQETYPELVSRTQVMAKVDSMGNELAPAMDLAAVNYVGLVPVLVSGHQQQENRLVSLEGQVAQLQSQLAQAMEQMTACCAGAGIGAGQRALVSPSTSPALENDLRVVPNPVADRTELRYTVANEGHVRLEITDASSRIVLKREEGQRTEGSYMYEWDTTLLAPGTYICTLYINDEFLVKKSVKLGTR